MLYVIRESDFIYKIYFYYYFLLQYILMLYVIWFYFKNNIHNDLFICVQIFFIFIISLIFEFRASSIQFSLHFLFVKIVGIFMIGINSLS